MYRTLDADLIVETCRSTQVRISERFTDSGLSKVAGEILTVSQQSAGLSTWLSRPHLPLRALAGVGIITIFIIIVSVASHIKVQMSVGNIGEFLQGLDAAINEVVFIGIAAFFFITLETRMKRQHALKAIRELRSLAHIIDMHQLTKDPERIAEPMTDTARISRRPQNPAELIRYLDYCSDLLALISKIAALYVQDFEDPVAISAVNEIENLTNGLSRKIWQKIMIFDRILAPGVAAPATQRDDGP
ncbi:MAG TPA: hypothetical protein VG347_22380 [Verrucomicrobiae bacterium]|nr:hypothetical protein [Verrucomicrobiae bacterium]